MYTAEFEITLFPAPKAIKIVIISCSNLRNGVLAKLNARIQFD